MVAAGEAPGARAFDAEHDLKTERLELSFSTLFIRPRTLVPYARAYRSLRKLIQRDEIARLHAARGAPEGLLALAVRVRTGIRYCCYAHGEEVNLSNREERPPWYRRRVLGSRELASMMYLVLRGADYVIANSENTRYILTRRWGLPERKVRLLYPGVDTTWFVPAPRDAAVRARLGWGERKVLLTVGRLQKRKGHDVMLRALATVRRLHPDALYSIVGDGDERSSLERLVDELDLSGHVQFLGEVDEETLLACYQQCDLFVLPNREIEGDIEGFGMVLLEAQACGKPVIAGQSGGTTEAMRAPDTGLVIQCHQAETLAAAVDDLALRRCPVRAHGAGCSDVGGRVRLGPLGRARRRSVPGGGLTWYDDGPSLRRRGEVVSKGRESLKRAARAAASVAVLPALCTFQLRAWIVGRDRALQSSSQTLALLPGLTGQYLRRAFYCRTLAACHASTVIEFGCLLSKADARLGENAYIGPMSQLGLVDIERDVLIASGVQIPADRSPTALTTWSAPSVNRRDRRDGSGSASEPGWAPARSCSPTSETDPWWRVEASSPAPCRNA